MNGTNDWETTQQGSQPKFVSSSYFNALTIPPLTTNYRYILGALKLCNVRRGSNWYVGWVLCYPDGTPITFAKGDASIGKISVSASGSYMFN